MVAWLLAGGTSLDCRWLTTAERSVVLRIYQLVFVAVTAAALTASVANPALAHSDLLQASPAQGSVVGGTVDFVDLVFTDTVDDFVMSVTGADGTVVSGAVIVAEGHLIRYSMDQLVTEGDYRVEYNMVSADGDFTEGGFSFTYSASAPEPLRVSPGTVPSGGPAWSSVLNGLVLAVVALALVIGTLEWRRRQDQPSPAR